jgi:zinc D-Ala-D-Ala carboxypeptidase
MKLKKIFIAFIPIFIAIIIIFASNTNMDKIIGRDTTPNKQMNNDSISKADSIKRLYLLGHFDPAKDTNFTLLKSPYSNQTGLYLRKEVYNAFKIMYDSAKYDGINLNIISATRNFDSQKSIWEGKFLGGTYNKGNDPATAKNILKYSSMPGTSRHHWGTDIDIFSVQLAPFETPAGKKLYNWLNENAGRYGFCQPYTAKDSLRKTGYEEEKWHWSFYPVSSKMLADYDSLITYEDISDFKGSETAKDLDVINNYVNSVNKNCK